MKKKEYRIYKRKNKGRARIFFRVPALFAVCLMPFLIFRTAAASEQEASISVRAESGEILLGEELPQIVVQVSLAGNEKAVLDKEKGYTVKDLADDLKEGRGYTLQCDADAALEGEYPVKITLDEEISTALLKSWIGLVTIDTNDGIFKVKNPVGEWEGNKFKRYDGTYVVGDFVVSKGNTYYFDSDGNKLTGVADINGTKYYFDTEGIRQTGWQEIEGAKYYFNAEGAAQTGWQMIDGDTYYFDQGGKMITGEKYLGLTLCVFGEDGKLISKKESSIDPNKPMVALTFDDGPGPRTKELLDALAKNNSHATFFMLGQKVPSYSGEVKRMKELGCELGNHSFDHADLSKLDAGGVHSEVDKTNENIKKAAGAAATVMRPPYGAVSDIMKTSAGMPMILWNIDTLDWKTRNAEKTIDTVMNSVKDGDIILMHDIHTESVDAAIELIPRLLEEGYQLVTVSELAAAKGENIQNGGVYTDF